MDRVLCDNDACLYNKNRDCQKEMIWIEDGECIDFYDYTQKHPDYQNEFYCQIRDPDDGKLYKVKHKGKRFEFYGHVFYTFSDDRFGLENMWFTEEITGYGMNGRHFLPNLDEEHKKKYTDGINKMIEKAVPVKDLPEKEDVA